MLISLNFTLCSPCILVLVFTHSTNECTIIIKLSLVPYICFGPIVAIIRGNLLYINFTLHCPIWHCYSLLFCQCYYFTLEVISTALFVGCFSLFIEIVDGIKTNVDKIIVNNSAKLDSVKWSIYITSYPWWWPQWGWNICRLLVRV
jgi:hypothetical protein